MSDCGHNNWSAWTTWVFYGAGQDIRERYCRLGARLGCTGDDVEYRQHQHAYEATADPFSPVDSGSTLMFCTGCHEPKG